MCRRLLIGPHPRRPTAQTTHSIWLLPARLTSSFTARARLQGAPTPRRPSARPPVAPAILRSAEGTAGRRSSGRGEGKKRVMGRARVAAALLLALAACAAMPAGTAANKISINWKPNTNYSGWEQQDGPFYKGDWLVFYYTAGQADVVQVDEAGYNKCDASHAIYNYSKGRTFAFELNETKTYYFICSYGYCYGGMRLAIKAEKLPPPSPPPSASDRSAAAALAAFASSHAAALYAAVAVLAALLRMV